MTAWGNYIQKEVEVQRNLSEHNEEFIRGRVTNVHHVILALKEDFGSKPQSLSEDVAVLKRRFLKVPCLQQMPPPKSES